MTRIYNRMTGNQGIKTWLPVFFRFALTEVSDPNLSLGSWLGFLCLSFIPNRSLGLAWILIFRRVDFVWLLMSNSELLRIKNKQKTSYKRQKTASSKYKNTINVLMTVLGLMWLPKTGIWFWRCLLQEVNLKAIKIYSNKFIYCQSQIMYKTSPILLPW